MIDPQTIANDIRDHLVDNPILHRLGMEVLWVAAIGSSLRIRVRHRDRVLTLEREDGWFNAAPRLLARQMAHELVGDALGTCRPTAPPERRRPPSGEPVWPPRVSHRS